MRLLAVMSAFNEADVLEHAIAALVAEGAAVHVVDNWSTDGSFEIAERWLGRGVVAVERFPADGPDDRYDWGRILTRKADVAHASDAAWVMSTDADEFREAPWAGVRLIDALDRVEADGCNAVNFQVLDFRPVDDDFVPGTDPREHLTLYEPGRTSDTAQVKLWRRPAEHVDLATTGGHDAQFEGRRVHPVPFVLRHYPIRGETHGRRKVLAERLPRFTEHELELGWHRQYDDVAAGRERFLRRPEDLVPYGDGAAIREELLSTAVSDLLLASELHAVDLGPDALDLAATGRWLVRHGAPGDPTTAQRLQEAAAATLACRPTEAIDRAAGLELQLIAWMGELARLCRVSGRVLLAQRCLQWQQMLREALVEDPEADDAALTRLLGPVADHVTATLAVELRRDTALFPGWLARPAPGRALVVCAADDELAALLPQFEAHDLEGPAAPDIVVVDVPPALWPALARRACEYLGAQPPPPLAGLGLVSVPTGS